MMSAVNPTVRHDALLVFDAIDSNPNGDPDNAGAPRLDDTTSQGLVTDTSIKRKIRDIVARRVKEGTLPASRNQIFITAGKALNQSLEEAYTANGSTISKDAPPKDVIAGREYMRENYFDVRMFGAVMSTGKASCGRITGPISIGIARSLDPVQTTEMGITRVAKTRIEDAAKSEMGSKTVVSYGLYTARIGYQPTKDNAVTEKDLELFWKTLINVYDITRSAARPDVNVRGLYVFTHEDSLGSAPARTLLDKIRITKNDGVDIPTKYDDYTISLPESQNLPSGVDFNVLI